MRITEITLKNKALSHFILLMVLMGGLYSYFKMGKLEDAPFTIKQALVITQYPGASPEEVEEQVSDILEEAIQSLDELDFILSDNRAGLSKITVNIRKETGPDDMQQLWDKLRRKVNDVQDKLPDGAQSSIVRDDFGDVLGVFYGLSGDGFTSRELDDYSRKIKNRLLQVPDVAKVERFGLGVPTIEVELSPGKMGEAGINISQLVAVFNAQNKVVNAGNIITETNRIRIEPSGWFSSVAAIENFLIPAPNGEHVPLKEMATVRESYLTPYATKFKVNGHPGVGIAVSTVQGGNVVDMAEEVKRVLGQVQETLPLGLELHNVYDQGAESSKANQGFINNLILSIATVVGILLLFIGFRTGMLIGSGLVFAILGTLLVMFSQGIALQRSSLAAIIIAMGMLVDNAIVVADAIIVNMQVGMTRREAINKAVKVSAMPLLGATFIAVLTFMPIYLSPHSTGEYFASLFAVIAVSLFLSWIFAITQTPLYCDQFLKQSKGAGQADPFQGKMYDRFRRILSLIIRYKWAMAATLVILLMGAVWGFKYIPRVFMPDLEKPLFVVDMWMPEGTKIEQTEAVMEEVHDYLQEYDEVVQLTTSIGQSPPRYYLANSSFGPQPNYGQTIVQTHSFEEVLAMKDAVNTALQSRFPSASVKINLFATMPAYEADIEARFCGPDANVLDSLVSVAKGIMNKNPKVMMPRNEWRNRVMVWVPEFDQNKARRVNTNRGQIAQTLAAYSDGAAIGVYRERDKQIPVMLKIDTDEVSNMDELENVPVLGANAQSIPLSRLTRNQGIKWEYPMIKRYNRERSMAAQCDAAPGYTNSEVLKELRSEIEQMELPEGYTMFWDAEFKTQKEAMEALTRFMPLAIILLVIVLIALFGNYWQPTIVMLILPLSLIGVSFGLLITGKEFGFNSIIGWLGLLGMIIKNIIVLLDEVNIQLGSGQGHYQAIVSATVSRSRPVVMAAATTICGMLPLLFDSVFGSMAATIIFGLTFATVLTLLAVPALYSIFYGIIPNENN
ncbi:MAG: efflux RND transporter permease subunit [Marinilabiliaceae bacterium]|nr:efflux RND transporter permease subunit [Marinilabiliaceae bacterium]